MGSHRVLWKVFTAERTAGLTLIAMAMIGWCGGRALCRSHVALARKDVVAHAQSVAARAQKTLQHDLSALGLMAHHQGLNNGADKTAFLWDAQQLGRAIPHADLISLIAADGHVLWVWPEQGHRAAIGFNAIEEPLRRDVLRLAQTTKTPQLSDKLQLVGGQPGFVAAAPIVTSAISKPRSGWVTVSYRAPSFVAHLLGPDVAPNFLLLDPMALQAGRQASHIDSVIQLAAPVILGQHLWHVAPETCLVKAAEALPLETTVIICLMALLSLSTAAAAFWARQAHLAGAISR